MLHARKDYDRIQDLDGIIPENEPVFLLRARDICAAETVRFWAGLAKEYGASPDMVASAMAQAELMEKWPHKHVPDMPEGAGETGA